MSFLGGAECSTAANPLSQFSKHVQDDKSLQRDRLIGRGPGGMQEGMRSQSMVVQDNVCGFLGSAPAYRRTAGSCRMSGRRSRVMTETKLMLYPTDDG